MANQFRNTFIQKERTVEMLQRGTIGKSANFAIVALTVVATPLSLIGLVLSWGSVAILVGALLGWASWDTFVLCLFGGMIPLAICRLGTELEVRIAWRSAASQMTPPDFSTLARIADQEGFFLPEWVRRRAAA